METSVLEDFFNGSYARAVFSLHVVERSLDTECWRPLGA